jgi:hypothetical protein
MTRPNRPRAGAGAEISDLEWSYLLDRAPVDADPATIWSLDFDDPAFTPSGRSTPELWTLFGAAAVAAWVHDRPGTRPSCWWRFEAHEPRWRVGGTGDPATEHLSYVPRYCLGLPVDWMDRWAVDFYHKGTAYDPHDPPQFEAQATYLQRLGLLLPGERRRLRPENFEPEVLADPGPPG